MTFQLKQIVCATDFSETSYRAVATACDLADKFDAELHILHVVHDLAAELPYYGEGLVFPGYLEKIGERQEELEAAAFTRMKELVGEEFVDSHRVAFAVELGKPFLEIIRFAKSVNADLIVMGTHGRGAIKHMFLGSVAEKVVQKAPCAVLTIRPVDFEFELP